jgi:hypothetical protein
MTEAAGSVPVGSGSRSWKRVTAVAMGILVLTGSQAEAATVGYETASKTLQEGETLLTSQPARRALLRLEAARSLPAASTRPTS